MDFIIKNYDVILSKAIIQNWKIEKYSYKNNFRPEYGFLYLISGFMTYEFNNQLIKLKEGDIIYLPKNSKYEVYFDPKNTKVENILINFDTVGESSFSDFTQPIKIFSDSNQELYSCFLEVAEAYTRSDKTFLLNFLLYKCFYKLQMNLCLDNKDGGILLLEKGASLLSEKINLTVGEISVILNMSRSIFQKNFKRYFGISPIKYRQKMQTEKAKLLLETTDMPIKEIAQTLYYYDLAYFYKSFERTVGLTPKSYREKYRTAL